MKNTISAIFLIVFFLLVLLATVGGGSFYLGMAKVVIENQPKLETLSKLQSLMQSEMVTATTFATGDVTKISGRKITLALDEEKLEIPISADARILNVIPVETAQGKMYEPKEGIFEDIKVGDNIYVNIIVTPDGNYEGIEARILPE